MYVHCQLLHVTARFLARSSDRSAGTPRAEFRSGFWGREADEQGGAKQDLVFDDFHQLFQPALLLHRRHIFVSDITESYLTLLCSQSPPSPLCWLQPQSVLKMKCHRRNVRWPADERTGTGC